MGTDMAKQIINSTFEPLAEMYKDMKAKVSWDKCQSDTPDTFKKSYVVEEDSAKKLLHILDAKKFTSGDIILWYWVWDTKCHFDTNVIGTARGVFLFLWLCLKVSQSFCCGCAACNDFAATDTSHCGAERHKRNDVSTKEYITDM